MDFDDGDGGRLTHARTAGRTGVYEGDAIFDDLLRLVRVAEDHHIRFVPVEDHLAHVAREVVRSAGVDEKKRSPAERATFDVAKTTVTQVVVGVAEDGRDGGDGTQRIEQRFTADVAGVQNVPHTGEQRGDPRIKMTVRVTDKTNSHDRYDIDFCRVATPA